MGIIWVFIAIFLFISFFVGIGTTLTWIARLFNTERILCSACGEYTSKKASRCTHCYALMDKKMHEKIIYIRKVRNELLDFKDRGVLPQGVFSGLDREYAKQLLDLLNELRPQTVKLVIAEEKKPVEYSMEEEPLIRKEHEIKKETIIKEEPEKAEIVPIQEEVKIQVVEKEEKKESVVSWHDKVIKSLLYVGVLGLISTVSIILYNQRQVIPDFVKFSILFLITASIFIGGYLLKFKFDYARTGLALIVLSALLLPMNYLSAKIFGLIQAGHTYTEWFGVALFCAVLYMALAKLIKDNVFVYLSTATGLVCVELLLLTFKLSIVLQTMIIVVLGALYLIMGYIFLKSDNKFYGKPFDYASRGIICLSIIAFIPNAYDLFHMHSYLTIAAFVSELMIFFMLASLLYKLPSLMYLSSISFIGCCINIILSLPSKNCTPAVPLYFVSYLTIGVGYILFLLNKKDYARPFYISGYCFGFFGLAFLGYGFLTNASNILMGFSMASVFYAASAHCTKKEFNTYLAIAVILGLIMHCVRISPIRIEGLSVILPVVGLLMCFLSRIKLPKYIVSPLYISSHLIVPMAVISFGVYSLVIEKYLYLLCASIFVMAVFYGYNAVISKNETFSYITIISILGFVINCVNVSALPFESLSVILTVLGLLMFTISNFRIPQYIKNPLAAFSHLIVPIVSISFTMHTFDVGRFGYLTCATLALASIFYAYNAVVSKNKIFSYVTITAVYFVFIAYLSLVKGLNIDQIMPIFVLISLLGSLIGIPFWKTKRELWAWPLLNISLITALSTVILAVFTFATSDLPVLNLMYVCLFGGIATIIHGIFRTMEKNDYAAGLIFIGGWLLNAAYMAFLVLNETKWSYIGLLLTAPSLIYLVVSYMCKKFEYLRHFFALCILTATTSVLALILSGIFDINVFLWTSLMVSIIFAIMAMISKKDIVIYPSIVIFILFFVTLLEVFNVYMQYRGLFVLGLSVILFALGRSLKPQNLYIYKNPFYVMGFSLTAGVPLFYAITDIDWFRGYINLAIITFVLISLIYGILSIVLKRRNLIYLSVILFGVAYTFMLQKFNVALFNYCIWFLSLGFAIAGIGKLSQPKVKDLKQNPFYVIGLAITALVIISLIAGSQFYLGNQINIAILCTLLCALMYGMLSYFLKERKIFYLSLLMLMGSYYLVLWKHRVNISEFYTIFPVVISIGWGIKEKIKKTVMLNVSPLAKINIGLCIYFIPGIYQALQPEAVLKGAIVGISALALILISLKTRVKYVFVSGISIFVFDILIQAFHFINFGAVPKVVWIGIGSVICIFIGFLGEKRFKEFVKSELLKTKKSIADYFSSWN